MQVYLFFVLIIAILVSIFAVQNATPVDVRFFNMTFQQISLVMVIMSSFTVGALAAFFLGLTKVIRSAIKLREMTLLNHQLKEEMERLRNDISKQRECENTNTVNQN